MLQRSRFRARSFGIALSALIAVVTLVGTDPGVAVVRATGGPTLGDLLAPAVFDSTASPRLEVTVSDDEGVAAAEVSMDGGATWMRMGPDVGSFYGSTVDASALLNVRGAEIAVSGGHSCLRVVSGGVLCWGGNVRGQLGDGSITDRALPVMVVGADGSGTLGRVIQVATGASHTCALLASGTVRCWGYSVALGTAEDRTSATEVAGLAGVAAIAAGRDHTCALLADRTVRCWGLNDAGQLGDGTTAYRVVPVVVKGIGGTGTLTGVTSIAAGSSHTCASITDGTVRCWGDGWNGQLGDGTSWEATPASTIKTTPVVVKGAGGVGTLTGVVSVASGFAHTCAARTDGTARCWGGNDRFQTGDGGASLAIRLYPVTVAGLDGVAALAAGSWTTCASRTDGTARCWGANESGQLGDPAALQPTLPVTVRGPGGTGSLTQVGSIAVGETHACAVRSTGAVLCWGTGPTAVGVGAAVPSPVLVGPFEGAGLATGGGGVCLIGGTDGTARCWGGNLNGSLGNGGLSPRWVPTEVTTGSGVPLTGIASIAVSTRHGCAAITDGTVRCWGWNQYYQLGNGTYADQTTAVLVLQSVGVALGGADSVAVGGWHSCAAMSDGTARCWGRGDAGQLGTGFASNRSLATLVTGLAGVRQIVAGSQHTCAALMDGTARCWGANGSGQLGDGTLTTRLAPVAVTDGSGGLLSGIVEIAAAQNTTCASITDGTVRCWGVNTSGRLGDGTTTSRATPVTVKGIGGTGTLTDVTSIALGAAHTCATRVDGSVACWGQNLAGQLGDGTRADRTTATTVLAPGRSGTLSGVVRLVGSGTNTCAQDAADRVWCWGAGGPSLGIGAALGFESSAVPTPVRGLIPTLTGGEGEVVCVRGRDLSGVAGEQTCSSFTVNEVTHGLTLAVGGFGSGTVGSSPAGIDCGATCEAFFGEGTTLRLTATPAAGSSFGGWTGCDATSGTTCRISLFDDRPVTAVFHPAPPTVVSFLPTSGAIGTSVTVTGTNFVGQVSCRIGTTPAPCTATSPTTVVTSIPTIARSTYRVVVETAGGVAQSSGLFSVGSGLTVPTVGSVSPNGGIAGTVVTITGANLAGAIRVKLGTATVSSGWTVLSATQLRLAVEPTAATGTVTVTTAGGTNTNLVTFTVYAPPTISAFSPASGPAGTLVTATGSNLLGLAAVSVGGVETTAFTATASSLTVLVPAGAVTGPLRARNLIFEGTSGTAFTVVPLAAPLAVSAGLSHSCAALTDGTARCWGLGLNGRLGDGSTATRVAPVAVRTSANVAAPLPGVVSVAAGNDFTCAALSDGTARCWGANGAGQLGAGLATTVTTTVAPVTVWTSSGSSTALPGVRQVVAGAAHACALLADRTARCWGQNSSGQLGNGGVPALSTSPVTVYSSGTIALTGIASLAAGGNTTCAAMTDGTARCWGANPNGQLGNGVVNSKATPFPAIVRDVGGLIGSSLRRVRSISAGGSHTCAALTDGTLRCWGLGTSGRLGNGLTTQWTSPVQVLAQAGVELTGATAVSAGGSHTCAVVGPQVRCWGSNATGQLGIDSTQILSASFPVATVGRDLSAVTLPACGGSHTLALLPAWVAAWGSNASGQLGDASTTTRRLPIGVIGF